MNNAEAIKAIKAHCYFANLKDEAKEALALAIKALEQTEWIPVSERLPKDKQEVLVSYEAHEKLWVDLVTYEDDEKMFHDFEWCNTLTIDEAFAWMPLPEPYKGEEA